MKSMDFPGSHEALAYSQTTRASKIFSDNVSGIGNNLNMSRKSIPDVYRTDMGPWPTNKKHEKS